MIWKCQGPRGADINVCASLNPNPTAHRQLSPLVMSRITPEMVNVHTAVCKAHFSCFLHLFDHLQLANKDLDLGLHPPSVEQQWKQRWASARLGSPLSTMNSPPDHQTVSRACSAPLNSLGDDAPGEKHKLQPQIQESVLSPAMCLVLLGWYRRPRPQDCSRHCTGYAVFLQLISCYTTRVSQIRITGISLQNRSSLFTKRWCRQVYFGLPNWGALCQFKLQVKSKYSGTSKPPYYTRSMYIKKCSLKFFNFYFKRLQAGFALGTSFSPVEYLLIYNRVSEKRIRHCLFNEDF